MVSGAQVILGVPRSPFGLAVTTGSASIVLAAQVILGVPRGRFGLAVPTFVIFALLVCDSTLLSREEGTMTSKSCCQPKNTPPYITIYHHLQPSSTIHTNTTIHHHTPPYTTIHHHTPPYTNITLTTGVYD
jgi:hypothetical protein